MMEMRMLFDDGIIIGKSPIDIVIDNHINKYNKNLNKLAVGKELISTHTKIKNAAAENLIRARIQISLSKKRRKVFR